MFRRLVIGFLVVYVLVGFFLFFNQGNFIYHPSSQDFYDCEGFSDYEMVDYNGTRFYFKYVSGEVIVYYHGNAGSACDRSHLGPFFQESNKSVMFVEYAGFSNDVRSPSEKFIQQDVRNVKHFLEENGFERVIVYGQSLGSGVAAYHASLGGVDGLVLVSAFSSLGDVAQRTYRIYPARFLLREEYDSVKNLKGFENSVMIIHGSDDRVISKDFSKKLFNNLESEKKDYVLIQGRDHNDLWDSQEFRDLVFEVISN